MNHQDLVNIVMVNHIEICNIRKSRLGNQQIAPHARQERIIFEVTTDCRIGNQIVNQIVTGEHFRIFGLHGEFFPFQY